MHRGRRIRNLFGYSIGFALELIPTPADGEFRLEHASHRLIANRLL
jgi:hypothetical protein